MGIIVGREKEREILDRYYNSGKAEFVAVYGRRRVGKTYLIKQHFAKQISFYATGIFEGSKEELLSHFNKQLNLYSGGSYPLVDNWFDAFDQLKNLIINCRKKRVLVFIDELPWFDSHKSRFVKALELFWNSWGADQENLMLVVCGSATTWMTNKIIGDKGGLHNRITKQIYLAPFTIAEAAKFLRTKKIEFTAKQLAEYYMIMGGVPFYLDQIARGKSPEQNINEIFFDRNSDLSKEYGRLYKSLFGEAPTYQKVVELLATNSSGYTQKEIAQKLKITNGGNLSIVLQNLCDCDFVTRYYAFDKQKRDVLYKLIDFYTLFYLHFIHGQMRNLGSWSNSQDSPEKRTWYGYAFELLCFCHIDFIKSALGISGTVTNVSSWRYDGEYGKAQIDLVIDRRDDTINLCEIKFSKNQYIITGDYEEKLEERKELFRLATGTHKALYNTLITINGLKPGIHNDCIQNHIDLSLYINGLV